ncbi:DUF2339 domain-containing protein [Tateyamaria sp. SN6-1]|uniref:DUF2339 domain-containing protein n=1 Tax=Tateyamaria sp. SN6-1 TaxID=3092148 RepID=UPI0039F50D90
MEGLLVLLGLVVLAIPVAVLYLLISHSGLKGRVAALEREIASLQADGRSAAATDAKPSPPKPTPDRSPAPKRAEPAAAKVIAARKAAASTPAKPPEPVGPGLPERVFKWVAANWFYVVSALSLALAGLFLVQYGVENGYLPPTARVLAALAFGAALIAGGEVIRRRFGDTTDVTTAYLPSVFSGAGLVSLFGGVTAARLLYDLIGVEVAFGGLAIVGLIGVVLGWFNGPLLAAVGVIGAFAAPLFVGSDVPATPWLYVYFAVVAAVGLAIDTVRRWAWVSVLSVVLGFGMGALTFAGGVPGVLGLGFQLFAVGLAVLAVLIPARSVWPDHPVPTLAQAAVARAQVRPVFPTMLAAGAVLAACLGVGWVAQEVAGAFWSATVLYTALIVALALWSVRGPGLQDLAVMPFVGLLAIVAMQGLDQGPVWRGFADAYAETSEADFPLAVTVLWGVGLALSAVAAWRGLRPGMGVAWAIAAALAAPAMAIVLEVTWRPGETIGAYAWALHGIVIAAVMVAFAARFARADGDDRLRVSVFVLAALAAITFALVLILSSAALTVALAVTVVAAAALDRQFRLPLMQVFITIGVVAVGARLIANPGLFWAIDDAAIWEVLLAYGGALAAFVAALVLLRGMPRMTAQVMLDTAAWSTGGVLVSLLLMRFLDDVIAGPGVEAHWAMGLYATIWLILTITQLIRLDRLGGIMAIVRGTLAVGFGLVAALALALGLSVFNPLLSSWGGRVVGPLLINTLMVAYLLPALVLGAGAMRLSRWVLRAVLLVLAGALGVFWAFVALRHVWQGSSTMELRHGFMQPELWSYTLALLLAGAVVFYQSLARGSAVLRRAGLVVIGAAVAKVFLIDISGLEGLTRVLSLMVLGLSLAGLAWLNRWAQTRAAAD